MSKVKSTRIKRDENTSKLLTWIKLLLVIVILLLLPQLVTSKRNTPTAKRKRRVTKAFIQAKSNCTLSCDPKNMAENQMCISKCLSQECHADIYQGNELEQGEIDDVREIQFEICVKDQLRHEIAASRRGTIGTLNNDKGSSILSGADKAGDDDEHENQDTKNTTNSS
jgi:hypothetical protein